MAGEGVWPKSNGDVLYALDANDLAGQTVEKTTGENVTAGNVVYINQNDGKVYVSGTGTADDIRADGIALTTATSGNSTQVAFGGVYVTTGLTANDTYYLGSAGAISTTRSGVQVGISISTTRLLIRILQDDKDVPGTIKAWHKSLTGMPSNMLTAFWKECDGAAISDAESPFDGQSLPNLNGTTDATRIFIRGSTTSSNTLGGASNHAHEELAANFNPATPNDEANWDANSNSTTVLHIPPAANMVMIMKIK